MTHSLAIIDVTPRTFDELKKQLEAAGYDQAFLEEGTIDLHGIGLQTAVVDDAPEAMADQLRAIVKELNRLSYKASNEGLNVNFDVFDRGTMKPHAPYRELSITVQKVL